MLEEMLKVYSLLRNLPFTLYFDIRIANFAIKSKIRKLVPSSANTSSRWICIGNHMISSAYLFQIAPEKSCDYLLINIHEKHNYNNKF